MKPITIVSEAQREMLERVSRDPVEAERRGMTVEMAKEALAGHGGGRLPKRLGPLRPKSAWRASSRSLTLRTVFADHFRPVGVAMPILLSRMAAVWAAYWETVAKVDSRAAALSRASFLRLAFISGLPRDGRILCHGF